MNHSVRKVGPMFAKDLSYRWVVVGNDDRGFGAQSEWAPGADGLFLLPDGS